MSGPRHARNKLRRERSAQPRYCSECARKGLRTRLNSFNLTDTCAACRRAAAERLAGYP